MEYLDYLNSLPSTPLNEAVSAIYRAVFEGSSTCESAETDDDSRKYDSVESLALAVNADALVRHDNSDCLWDQVPYADSDCDKFAKTDFRKEMSKSGVNVETYLNRDISDEEWSDLVYTWIHILFDRHYIGFDYTWNN